MGSGNSSEIASSQATNPELRPTGSSGDNLFYLSITSQEILASLYMPFVRTGGLFIPTTRKLNLGDTVFLLLTLQEGTDTLPLTGTVIWKTPERSHRKKIAGIGIGFHDEAHRIRASIEKYLPADPVGRLASATM